MSAKSSATKEPRRGAASLEQRRPLQAVLGRKWERLPALMFVLGFAVCGAASVLMGQDNNWDLRNYHYYNPFAFVTGRIGYDFAPAQRQSYLNPLLDLPFYFDWEFSTGAKQDFESFQLSETTTNTVEQPTVFAYPPLPWIGARFKFEIREKDGTKTLTKTIDNPFFQRATVFIGDPTTKNYTIEADVMSEGNRRKMSEVGLINQRYLIVLKGNDQKLEISSNLERLRVPASVDPPNFPWSPKVWYHLKARVDSAADGSGVIRAKAWKRGETEPDKWTLEVPHKNAHQNGSPGLYGFSPQDMRVYFDNIAVTPNEN
jgi:hypothetical protein